MDTTIHSNKDCQTINDCSLTIPVQNRKHVQTSRYSHTFRPYFQPITVCSAISFVPTIPLTRPDQNSDNEIMIPVRVLLLIMFIPHFYHSSISSAWTSSILNGFERKKKHWLLCSFRLFFPWHVSLQISIMSSRSPFRLLFSYPLG